MGCQPSKAWPNHQGDGYNHDPTKEHKLNIVAIAYCWALSLPQQFRIRKKTFTGKNLCGNAFSARGEWGGWMVCFGLRFEQKSYTTWWLVILCFSLEKRLKSVIGGDNCSGPRWVKHVCLQWKWPSLTVVMLAGDRQSRDRPRLSSAVVPHSFFQRNSVRGIRDMRSC